MAERAGVGRATVYRSYPSKEGLIGQLVAAARSSGKVRPAVRQLIVLDERDPAVWRRYADLVLNALRP
ncbi:TetR family transcriptional regulator [Micromonospora sp. DT201]|uniref:TetR family transcriptional regulator n=1 Tax=Micromonospora sp. DT201 TaxID=3393442 RepID=UPI003CF3D7DD